MTIYIVTEGYYSDYTIRRCFTNPEAANEYKLWHNIDNPVEEYELYDTPFTEADLSVSQKYWWVDLEASVLSNGDVIFNPPKIQRRMFCGPHNTNVLNVVNNEEVKYRLRVCRSFLEGVWDKDIMLRRMEKTAYDLIGQINYLLSEGEEIWDIKDYLIDHKGDLAE